MGGPVDLLEAAGDIAEAAASTEPDMRAYPSLRDAVSVPAVVAVLNSVDYQIGLGRSPEAVYLFDLTLLVSRVNEATGQSRLYKWLAGGSDLITAINNVTGAAVLGCTQIGIYTIGTVEYLGATLAVEFRG